MAASPDSSPQGAAAPQPDWVNVHARESTRTVASLRQAPPHDPRRWARVLLRNPNARIGLGFLGTLALIALLAPVFFPGDPFAIVGAPHLWPGQNAAFPLGTDSYGRDVLTGLVYGTRVSLLVGLAAAALSLVLGIVIGALAGYFGGWTDRSLTRLTEIFQTMPSFVLLVVLVAITSTSIKIIIVAIALITWPNIARLVRAEYRSQRQLEYVVAARSLGYGNLRIIFSDILPNALPAVIVTASTLVASAILMEAALSFMGFGDPNAISWGTMIGAGREYLRSSWYLTAIPGLAIVLTVMAINLVGDAINDALNPRLREPR
ncbi:ABC transporter permease [Bordetella genomosp. 12]|uniref:ABC transporter permease n=1 Tax=Bordetella genomosp. 12 TaxID=463035 RepID=A0A261VDN3_9BORD|nr:ABC transporter permease [Bordetella genomosp. 12]OZI71662.1 ABC transporter permease [Bordetella genomosp. 12]